MSRPSVHWRRFPRLGFLSEAMRSCFQGVTVKSPSIPVSCLPLCVEDGFSFMSEIMKLIMDVALLGVPFQRGDSRLLKLRIEKFKSSQFIADNFRVSYQAVL